MEISKRRSVLLGLKDYCYLSDEHSYIEVTEWTNGEGVDVHVSRKDSEELFNLTYGELDALVVGAKAKDSDEEEDNG